MKVDTTDYERVHMRKPRGAYTTGWTFCFLFERKTFNGTYSEAKKAATEFAKKTGYKSAILADHKEQESNMITTVEQMAKQTKSAVQYDGFNKFVVANFGDFEKASQKLQQLGCTKGAVITIHSDGWCKASVPASTAG